MAMIMSRMNPEIRLRLVQNPTIPAARVISFFSEATGFSAIFDFKINEFSDRLVW
jgi:hypothetical protein